MMGNDSRKADFDQSEPASACGGSSLPGASVRDASHADAVAYIEGSQALLNYLDCVLKGSESAQIDVGALPELQRPLASKIVALGSFVRDVQVLTKDLAQGHLAEAPQKSLLDHDNPLVSSLDGIRMGSIAD